MKSPNFFIAGAPKCGTSAMWEFLKGHPQIFMSNFKEPHFFASDLKGTYFIRDPKKYADLFAGSEGCKRVGEASGWYLFSSCAAREIREFNPESRIIIMLRNPVDFMHSYHSQRVYAGTEDLLDFEEALRAEADRKQGRRLPSNPETPHGLQYREVAKFSSQVQRYFDVFGRQQVHVILLDDFRKDAAGVFRQTLRFLEVDEDYVPEFVSVNANKQVRSRMLRRTLQKPPALARGIARAIMPLPMRQYFREFVKRLNTRYVSRQPMPPGLRKELEMELQPEILQLGKVLGKDLSCWYSQDSAQTHEE